MRDVIEATTALILPQALSSMDSNDPHGVRLPIRSISFGTPETGTPSLPGRLIEVACAEPDQRDGAATIYDLTRRLSEIDPSVVDVAPHRLSRYFIGRHGKTILRCAKDYQNHYRYNPERGIPNLATMLRGLRYASNKLGALQDERPGTEVADVTLFFPGQGRRRNEQQRIVIDLAGLALQRPWRLTVDHRGLHTTTRMHAEVEQIYKLLPNEI